MTTISAIQSSYIPWTGFFHIVQRSDVFVSLEDVQYTVRDWRNRNRVKLPGGGTLWLSVPVKGGRDQLLCNALIDDSQPWRRTHRDTLRACYARAPHFRRYFPALETIYYHPFERLVDLNFALLTQIAQWLAIGTRLVRSDGIDCRGRKDDKLICLVKHFGGTRYLSGPSARAYMIPENYARAGIQVEYMDYAGYPEYRQLSDPFEHQVSILDLLFMTGDEAPDYIWGGRSSANEGEA